MRRLTLLLEPLAKLVSGDWLLHPEFCKRLADKKNYR